MVFALALRYAHDFLDTYPLLGVAFLLVGVVISVLCLVLFASRTFLVPSYKLSRLGVKPGEWAVVTGASDGIGREFALQLAASGYNVFLAARNPEKLEAVVREIQQNTNGKVKTEVFLIDFAHASDAQFGALREAMQALDIHVLVNNVGKSHEMPVDFIETDSVEMQDIIAINVAATVRVTSFVVASMTDKRRGVIINIGSFAGAVPSPMLATYSASKAFLKTFSDALAAELGPYGVIVTHANTYFVVSAMSKIRKASLMIPTPRAYVRSVLGRLVQGSCAPYWPHACLEAIMSLFPDWLVSSYVHNMHRDIRKRALRKKERLSKKQ
ncbi:3-ketoacyl-CoA reductase [Vararia minispora EC-137]|uniref:3-ketoacyl-CoA reductase n=1 Tax=Vararia minispora EC-137 TaxID=1314806 RepID=A0ACB8QAF4_9AGAM|nr:3-ketoacyl-CoA reductase [Vararia minispora EC-137]